MDFGFVGPDSVGTVSVGFLSVGPDSVGSVTVGSGSVHCYLDGINSGDLGSSNPYLYICALGAVEGALDL